MQACRRDYRPPGSTRSTRSTPSSRSATASEPRPRAAVEAPSGPIAPETASPSGRIDLHASPDRLRGLGSLDRCLSTIPADRPEPCLSTIDTPDRPGLACPRSTSVPVHDPPDRPLPRSLPVHDPPRSPSGVLGRILFGVTSPEQMCRCRTLPAEVLRPAGARTVRTVAPRGNGHGGPRHDLDPRPFDHGAARPVRSRRRLHLPPRWTSSPERHVLAPRARRRPTALSLVSPSGEDPREPLRSADAPSLRWRRLASRGRSHRRGARRGDCPPACGDPGSRADGNGPPRRDPHDRPPRYLAPRGIRCRDLALDADPSVEARHAARLRPTPSRPPRRPSRGRLSARPSRA